MQQGKNGEPTRRYVGELIWERIRRAKSASRKLEYPQMVRAAMGIADNEGLDALSMRNVGQRLSVGTMSLYRYVASKDQLLDLILDAAYGEIAVPDSPTGDWQAVLRSIAGQTRVMLRRHAWLGPLLTRRPTLGPNYLRWFEFLLAATSTLGLDIRTQARMIGTVHAYIAGFVGYELGEIETNRRHNLTEQRKRELAAPYLQRIFREGRYPQLVQFVGAEIGEPTDQDFEFGLEAVLAGLSRVAAT